LRGSQRSHTRGSSRLSARSLGAFNPNGGVLIASYDTGRAYRWDIRPEALARQACRVAGRRVTR
jgi:hypothetical protein